MVHEFTGGQGEQIIGHGHERFQAFVTCILLFVLLNNLWDLFPRVVTPTSQPVVPLGHCGADVSLLQLPWHSGCRDLLVI